MSDGWDLIFSYTRSQAIEDGVLVDISDIARESGFKIPVALTSSVYEKYIKTDLPSQDERGRLHDLLFVLYLEARGCEQDTIFFEVLFKMTEAKSESVKLKAVIGPGDTVLPVITIMHPFED